MYTTYRSSLDLDLDLWPSQRQALYTLDESALPIHIWNGGLGKTYLAEYLASNCGIAWYDIEDHGPPAVLATAKLATASNKMFILAPHVTETYIRQLISNVKFVTTREHFKIVCITNDEFDLDEDSMEYAEMTTFKDDIHSS